MRYNLKVGWIYNLLLFYLISFSIQGHAMYMD